MVNKNKIARMKRAKNRQMKMRKMGEIAACVVGVLFFVSVPIYAKMIKPDTIPAKVVSVEYHNGETKMLAELPDGNVEWWTFDYTVYNIPETIEILAENHQIYDYPN